MTAAPLLFQMWADDSALHMAPSDPQVAVVLGELREVAALDRENTGYESDRELYVMRRWPDFPRGAEPVDCTCPEPWFDEAGQCVRCKRLDVRSLTPAPT